VEPARRTPRPLMAWPEWFTRVGLPDPFRWPDFPSLMGEAEDELIRVEQYMDGDTLVIRAELPGIDPENDVELTVSDGVLHLRAHRQEESREEKKGSVRSEFRYGSFSRSVRLPAGAGEADVTATYKDGILEVRVPVDTAKSGTSKVKIDRA